MLLGSGETARFRAEMPSGLLPGPANFAPAMCFCRYKTGNTTEIITGALAGSRNIPAKVAGSISLSRGHGSREAPCAANANGKRGNANSDAINSRRFTFVYYFTSGVAKPEAGAGNGLAARL